MKHDNECTLDFPLNFQSLIWTNVGESALRFSEASPLEKAHLFAGELEAINSQERHKDLQAVENIWRSAINFAHQPSASDRQNRLPPAIWLLTCFVFGHNIVHCRAEGFKGTGAKINRVNLFCFFNVPHGHCSVQTNCDWGGCLRTALQEILAQYSTKFQ